MNKTIRIGLLLLALAAVTWLISDSELLGLLGDVESLQAWIASFGLLGYIVFMLIYVAACVFMLPGSALTVTAGIVFGPVTGGVVALISGTLGASMAFLVARFVIRDAIVRRFGENPVFQKIDDGVAQNGLSFLLLTRLVPIFPFNVQNYAYGLTSLKLVPYTLITLVTMAPITFIFAYTAGDIATNGVSAALLVKLGIAGILLSALSQLPRLIARRRGIDMDQLAD